MSKQQSVETLYTSGLTPREIAARLGLPRRDVTRCISDIRRRDGQSTSVVAERVADYAAYNHRKSVAGARKALEAMRA